MYILGFETTGPICSVALIDLDNPNRIFVMDGSEPMSHLKSLTDNAKKLMKDSAIGIEEIAAVAASIGPGSFTGIRIGVTTARTVAQALGIPCVAVPTLDAFRCRINNSNIVVPILNARRGQVYGAILSGDFGDGDILAPGPYMLKDVLDKLKEYLSSCCEDNSCDSTCGRCEIKFYGDGIDAYKEILDAFKNEVEEKTDACKIIFAEEVERHQTADTVVCYAMEKYKSGDTVSYEELLPDYMRKAEAEQKLEDGTLQKLREEKLARLMAGN